MLNVNTGDWVDNLADQFRSDLQGIAQLFTEEDVEVVPFSDPSLSHFKALSNEVKRSAAEAANSYYKSLKNCVSSGWSLREDQKALWSALRLFGLTPTSDVLDCIKKNHSVELYDADGIQIWRNFRFMEVCGYTLEEVFCYTWQQRYKRDELATQKILEVLSEMTTQKKHKTVRPQIKNILVETFSSRGYIIDVMHEYMSPLVSKSKQMAGFLVASNVRIIGSSDRQSLPLDVEVTPSLNKENSNTLTLVEG